MERRIVITLDADDVREMERILIDHDEKDALRFLRERIEKKVDAANRTPMKRPFG